MPAKSVPGSSVRDRPAALCSGAASVPSASVRRTIRRAAPAASACATRAARDHASASTVRQRLQSPNRACRPHYHRLQAWAAIAPYRQRQSPATGQDRHDIVLSQIHQREAERQGVCPGGARPPTRPHLAEQDGGHQGCGEMQRGHRGQWVASKDTVERLPAILPEGLAKLDQVITRRMTGSTARLAGRLRSTTPRPALRVRRTRAARSGKRMASTTIGANVEYRVGHHRRPRKAPAVTYKDVEQRAVRNHEPRPVGPHQHAVQRSPFGTVRPPPRQRALQAQRGQLAQAQRAVGGDRVVDVHPSLKRRGIVVRRLVGGEVRPHLQGAGGHVTSPASGARLRTGRPGAAKATACVARSAVGLGRRRLTSGGSYARCHDHPPGGCSNSARPPHLAGSIDPRPARNPPVGKTQDAIPRTRALRPA